MTTETRNAKGDNLCAQRVPTRFGAYSLAGCSRKAIPGSRFCKQHSLTPEQQARYDAILAARAERATRAESVPQPATENIEGIFRNSGFHRQAISARENGSACESYDYVARVIQERIADIHRKSLTKVRSVQR